MKAQQKSFGNWTLACVSVLGVTGLAHDVPSIRLKGQVWWA